MTHAARQAGVTRDTVYQWLEDESFVEAIKEAASEIISECFQGLRVATRKGNAQAIKELMAQVDPEVFDRERELLAIRHSHEMAVLERKHQHDVELLKLRAQLGMPATDDTPEPDFTFEETGPGERRAPEDAH